MGVILTAYDTWDDPPSRNHFLAPKLEGPGMMFCDKNTSPEFTNMTIAGKSTMNESMYFLLKMGGFSSKRHVSELRGVIIMDQQIHALVPH